MSNLTSDEVNKIETDIPGTTTTLDIKRTYVKTAGSDEKERRRVLRRRSGRLPGSQRGRRAVEMIAMEAHKRHKAAVMVTHDQRVLDLADAVYRMEDGRLVRQ